MQKTVFGITQKGALGETSYYPGIINLSEKEHDICPDCSKGILEKNSIAIKCAQTIVPDVPVLSCSFCGIDIVCAEGAEYTEKFLRDAAFIYSVKSYQKTFSNQARVEFWKSLTEDYCPACGDDNPDCHCSNDE